MCNDYYSVLYAMCLEYRIIIFNPRLEADNNNKLLILVTIIIRAYFKYITHTDDFPLNGYPGSNN